ncbi:cyclase family protein [Petroclostridium sp. X23]|uniref:cyclase family protein n=1 Tax=Petroclostridium sp. X23 TaxID=3045146 RepID=UPI0024AD055C|nr:cyclase family protein [Petroclostridium sp. X23]WHH57867.1 cyclase family protein [Petroclostridium sp. X23]
MKMIDISKGVLTSPVYPGDPEPELQKIYNRAKNDQMNLSVLKACVHTGTHADSPSHYLDSSMTVDKLPLELFIGRCKVVPCSGIADNKFVSSLQMDGCKILLVKGNISFGEDVYTAIVEKGITTIGTEADTIGDDDVHKAILGRNIAVLENLDLSQAAEGEYFLVAPPVKIEESDGAFVRAVLIEGFQSVY